MKALDLFFAARPLLHLPLWSVYLVSLHYHLKLSGESFQWNDLLMLLCLSLMAAAAYYVNQIHDHESDRLNQKLGFLQRGYLKEKQLRIFSIVLTVAALAVTLSFSLTVFFIFVQAMCLNYFYSVPPLRLKDRPVGGLMANAYAFGWLVPFTVMPEITLHSSGLLSWGTPFYFFFAVAAVHVLTTIPDRDGDRAEGSITIAVWMHPIASRLLAVTLLAASGVVAWVCGYDILFYVSLFSLVTTLGTFLTASGKPVLLAAKLPILLLTLVAGYHFPAYLSFVVALVILTRIYYARRFAMVYPRLN